MLISDISSELLHRQQQQHASDFADHSSLNAAPQQIFIWMNLQQGTIQQRQPKFW